MWWVPFRFTSAQMAHYHTLHVRRVPAALPRLSPEQREHSTRFNGRCPDAILESEAKFGKELSTASGEACI